MTGYCAYNIFDRERATCTVKAVEFDPLRLEYENFIDMNVFMHCKSLVERCGGFDERLRRLVDWDFVLRYTRIHKPFFVRAALVDYIVEPNLIRITTSEAFAENYAIMASSTLAR
jgi:hypothetical protein